MKWLRRLNQDIYVSKGKRLFDVFLALAMIIVLAPLMLTIAAAIKLTSRGPVVFRRKIVGFGGKTVYAYKFRTMVNNAENLLITRPELYRKFKEKHKLEGDFRVTAFGTFLRKFSLDEIPQLFNVLKGEMSIIGPRMIHPDELPKYGDHQQTLLSMKPSMTGYWQVNGRQQTTYEERVEMDLYYIENCCFTLDVMILLLTPITVLKAEGAH
ncbi:MAG: sugar transferase [Deltaproteobacteria bacterium]|nr:sugar transferase [Deltaproteobacteria bacterium]